MFKQLKNIDSAFKYIRGFCLLLVTGSLLLCGFAVYKTMQVMTDAKQKIYILANGKILETFAADRKDNIPVEARDHVKMFHQYFFTLDPDDKVIQTNLTKALYLADISAKREWILLKYYIR